MEFSFGASRQLLENREAQALHAAGLSARFSGKFTEAYHAFDEAAATLREETPTVDQRVQLARVLRDRGSTSMLEAVATEEITPLADANYSLTRARQETAYLIDSGHGEQDDIKSREITAAHAKTVSLLGRMITLSAVLLEFDTRGKGAAAAQDRTVRQKHYGEAHRLFLKGNDSSGLVEHALFGARQERLNGQRLRMLPWLSRAARGLIWTMMSDPEDLPNAWAAVGQHLPSLRSYKAARAGVLHNP